MKVLLQFLLCLLIATPQSQGPVFSFLDKRIVDYGDIKSGEIVEITVRFMNSGDEPLIIRGVNTSCNCTSTVVTTDPIQPNTSSAIYIKVDTSNKIGPEVITVRIAENTKQKYQVLRINLNVL